MLEYETVDIPRDTFGSTDVVFRIAGGDISAYFTNGSHVACMMDKAVQFKARGVAFHVAGMVHLWAASGWDDVNPDSEENKRMAARGAGYRQRDRSLRDLTPKRADVVVAELREIIADYAGKHPQVLAHAEHRARARAYVGATRKAQEAREAYRKACLAVDLAEDAWREAGNAVNAAKPTTPIREYHDRDGNYKPVDYA